MSVSAPLAAIRAQHPLLHCISNIVSANDCANLALAIGASPIMAQAPQEMADIAFSAKLTKASAVLALLVNSRWESSTPHPASARAIL